MSLTHLLGSLLDAILPVADAHCDTADGPAVTDGRRALETGNINHALKWIQAGAEAELAEASTRRSRCASSARRPRKSPTGCSWKRWCGCTA